MEESLMGTDWFVLYFNGWEKLLCNNLHMHQPWISQLYDFNKLLQTVSRQPGEAVNVFTTKPPNFAFNVIYTGNKKQ